MLKRRHKAIIAIAIFAISVQVILWISHGRSRLPAAVALYDAEFSAKQASLMGFSSDQAYDYLVLSEPVFDALEPEEFGHFKDQIHSYSKVRVLSPFEWYALSNDLQPKELWETTRRTTHVFVAPSLNTPLIAIVNCDDGGGTTVGHGHKHIFAYLLGVWFPVKAYGDWVS